MTTPSQVQQQPTTRSAGHVSLWLMPLAGFVLSLAFPNELMPGWLRDHPPGLLAWVALLPVMWAVLALPGKEARRAVWLYSAAFYLGTLTWMRLFGYLPWALLAGCLSLTPWLALHLTQRMPQRRAFIPLGFALSWTGLEWVRGQGMFGLPWSEIGASQVDGFPAHIAAVGGIPLLTFMLLWLTGTMMLWIVDRRISRWTVMAVLVVSAACAGLGEWQAHAAVTRWQRNPRDLHLSLVQPNSLRGLTPEDLIVPADPEGYAKWQQKQRARLERLVALSYQTASDFRRQQVKDRQPHLVIWPESSLAFPPTDPEIATLTLRSGSLMLVGAPAYDYLPQTNAFTIRNAAYLLGASGIEIARYDKIHLVPFGEFVPFRGLVTKFYTVRPTDIVPGRQRIPLQVGTHHPGVGICFESTFPYISREYALHGADLLIFITNDAWFHQTSGVRQHLNHARFRAIETGLPVARTAGTGVSAFIAPDGRVLQEIPTYTTGTRLLSLPAGVPGTLFTRIGWLFGPACLAASLLLALLGLFTRRKQPVAEPQADRKELSSNATPRDFRG